MKKIVITAGGTCEYIDDVRVLTNISSGKFGSIICDTFAEKLVHSKDHEIVFIYGKFSSIPKSKNIRCIKIVSAKDALVEITKECVDADVVIHSMAVGDYGFIPISGKFSSNSPDDMLNLMKDRIFINPKIIDVIKKINPKCYLVGFKFLSNATMQEETAAVEKLFKSASCDMIIYNDKNDIKKDYHETSVYILDENASIGRICINRTKQEAANYLCSLCIPVPDEQ